MRKLALLLILAAAVLSTAAVAVAGATKETLLKEAFGLCTIGATGGTPTPGFAIINAGDGQVLAEVAVKKGPANARWVINLVQTPSGESCFGTEAILETNGQGTGNVHLAEPLLAGTTGAFVVAYPDNAAANALGILATDGTLLG